MNNNEELNKIDITSMIGVYAKTIRKFWVPIIAMICVSIVGFYLFSKWKYVPQYQSQATFSVNAENNGIISGGTVGDEQIKESLPYILESNVMKNMVKEDLGLESFPAEIALESKETANFYVLKITAGEPQLAQDIMQTMLENISEASVYVLGKIQIEVLDESGLTASPINQFNAKTILILGGSFGVMVSAAFVMFYALTDHTIRNKDDFKKYLSVTCVETVPKMTFKKRRKEIDKHIHIHNDKVGYAFHEVMRSMRARVMRVTEKNNYKVILVTSSVPGEGKSTIAANLALSIAERGKRVMLVDMDLRNPSIKQVLGLEQEKVGSVVDLLGKKCTLREAILRKKEWNMDLMLGGEPVTDPTAYITTKRLEKLIQTLKENYDYVILDTPPAAMLADATSIARCADCALYVVKQDGPRVERIVEGLEILTFSKTPVIGAILNSAESAVGGYGNRLHGRYGDYSQYSKLAGEGTTEEYVDVEI